MKRGALRAPRVWLGLGLSGLFFYLAFRNTHPAQLMQTIRGADLGPLFVAFFLAYVILLIRARRWGIIIRGIGRPGMVLMFKAALFGFLGNYLLPARAGEVLRAMWLGARASMRPSSLLATVVLERLLDLYSIVIMFSIIWTSGLIPAHQGHVKKALGAMALALAATGVTLTVLLWLWRSCPSIFKAAVERTIGRVSPRLARLLMGGLDGFTHGLRLPRMWSEAGEIVLWTALIWVLSGLVVLLAAHAFNLQIPWDATIVVLVALGLAVSVPSAPGFMGTFHYAAMSSIMLYGVEEAQALSFAIALHGLCVLPVLVLGIPIVLSEGLSLKDISEMRKKGQVYLGHGRTSSMDTSRGRITPADP